MLINLAGHERNFYLPQILTWDLTFRLTVCGKIVGCISADMILDVVLALTKFVPEWPDAERPGNTYLRSQARQYRIQHQTGTFSLQEGPRMTDDSLPTERDHISAFEKIRRVNAAGNEYWTSRDLAGVLGYADYRNFEKVVHKAETACFNSGQRIEDHFVDVTEMVRIGSGAEREIATVYLSRYACYLIVQNADPSKPVVAVGQTYFAVQTRRQELTDQGIASEDDLRLQLRADMKEFNKKLASTAKRAGVVQPVDYAIFQNHGYQGLYGGLTMQDIHRRKGLKKSQNILDHMGSEELAANAFRATQAESKIRREGITGKDKANRAHREVGTKVRQTIKEIGGTMPEHLPTPDTSAKQLESKRKKLAAGKPAKKPSTKKRNDGKS